MDRSLPWVRFHSLPSSKRYPGNDVDEGILLGRAYILGSAVLGQDADCWLVECRPQGLNPPLWRVPLKGAVSTTFADGDEGTLWCAHVSMTHWRQGAFDSMLLAIADEKTGPTLWMDRQTGRIFAPYYSGFDLFPSSADEVEQLRTAYRDWPSSHPKGL
ncbi:hypothetical protein QA648_24760 (plasmid) [Rhizobium sp. CB3171]|uniref:DUF3885 domain-containing protein n=1 Tax=Rhizobium sp. CB3171 TaxID=3039157 RepID=UPI0024B10D29|nr:hypothetical protein [Rhizobium sp. CB3171]WFU06320.1 hypothetical protein QA648_24760 [Rhizobium sp. CB3171]